MNKEQVQFVAQMAKEFPQCSSFLIANASMRLMALARKAQQNAENLCNTPNAVDQSDKICKRIVHTIHEWELPSFGFKVTGDPRGYCLKLHLPSGTYNTFGGKEDGYGVPC